MMLRRSLANLRRKAEHRPDGYLPDVLAVAAEVNETEGWYTLADEDFADLRKRWTPERPARPVRPPTVSDYGDRYKASLGKRIGGVPCGACQAERVRMNTLAREQCIAEREQIIDGTVNRALNHPHWSTRIKAKLADTFAPDTLRRIIGEAFDEAMST